MPLRLFPQVKPISLTASHHRLLTELEGLVSRIREHKLGDFSPLMDEIFDSEDAISQAVTRGLDARGQWLLKHLAEKNPNGVATTTALPYPDNLPGGRIGMAVMNGLVKRGLAMERGNGIFFITSRGLKAAQYLMNGTPA